MVHKNQKHGDQSVFQESVAQQRQLDRAACAICGTIRSRRGNRCNHFRADTATLDVVDMLVGDIFEDGRQQVHQDAAASQPNFLHLPISSQPIRQRDLPDDSPLPSSPSHHRA